jgi:predicted DsbA family dithiol-disulfide isomerase
MHFVFHSSFLLSDLLEYLTKKYGAAAMERFNKPNNPLETAGRSVGISFNKTRRFINTVDGHRLMEWCNQTHPDQANDLMEHLFRAYFQDAKDLSNVHELVNVAMSVGLPEATVKSVLESDQYRSEVLGADERSKRNLRVSGVPYFIVENNNGGRPVAFSGAQVSFPSLSSLLISFPSRLMSLPKSLKSLKGIPNTVTFPCYLSSFHLLLNSVC